MYKKPMLFTEIKIALRKNLIPGMALQALALFIVVSYFFIPASHVVFNLFSSLKSAYGPYYSMISTALFGGLIPFLYLWRSGQLPNPIMGQAIFYTLFWAYKGVEVDQFYLLQGEWFGFEANAQTIFAKVAMDQFVYTAFWSAPTIMVLFLWKDLSFSWGKVKQRLNKQLFFVQLPTVIVANWLVWIPAVSIIYLMPSPLQIPLFNLVLCFFVLILAVINKPKPVEKPVGNGAVAAI